MKILYIVPFVPWEIRVRSFNLIPRLSRNHEIILVCVSRVPPTKEQLERLSIFCERIVHVEHRLSNALLNCLTALPTRTPLRMAYCASRRAQDVVAGVCQELRPDVVYVERWRAVQFVPKTCTAPIVADPTDSMTLYNQRLMKGGLWWERLVGWEEHKKFARYEGALAKQVDTAVFCSRRDMEVVRSQAPDACYELVPNGVDCKHFFFKDENEEEANTLVFTGSFNYRPNLHAAQFFLRDIFPLIRERVPDAKFIAVGNGAASRLAQYRGMPGLTAVDFVPDLRPYLAKATVAVAPLTVGSGVSNKLLEGFAVGTPVVATPLACGDLPIKSGEHLVIASTANEFAEHVVALLRSRLLRKEIATRAHRLVADYYDWEIISPKLEGILESATMNRLSANNLEPSGVSC